MAYMRLTSSLVMSSALVLTGCLSGPEPSEPGSIQQLSSLPDRERSTGKADEGNGSSGESWGGAAWREADGDGASGGSGSWAREREDSDSEQAEATAPGSAGGDSSGDQSPDEPCSVASCSEVWLASPPGTFADETCAAAVCDLDEFCCDGNWDEGCTDCADGGDGFAGICAGQISPEDCSCQADPCDAKVAAGITNAEPSEADSEPGAEPLPRENTEDSGSEADDGDSDQGDASVWDWGDSSVCDDCDAAAFEGVYDIQLVFQGKDADVPVCEALFEATVDADGALQYETKCISTTGLSFGFGFDLYTHFNCAQASTETGCLAGTATLELPSGEVLQTTVYETEDGGYVTTAEGPWVYWSLYASYLVTIETPSGPLEYGVYTSAPLGQ